MSQEGGDICLHTADSLPCIAEIQHCKVTIPQTIKKKQNQNTLLLTSFPKDYKFLEGTFGCLGLCVGGLYGLGSENCVRWGSGPLLYQ